MTDLPLKEVKNQSRICFKSSKKKYEDLEEKCIGKKGKKKEEETKKIRKVKKRNLHGISK